MPAQWTAELISKMHAHRITQLALAQKLGYTPQYVSTVLNSKRDPAGAEQKFNSAVDSLIEQQNSTTQPVR